MTEREKRRENRNAITFTSKNRTRSKAGFHKPGTCDVLG